MLNVSKSTRTLGVAVLIMLWILFLRRSILHTQTWTEPLIVEKDVDETMIDGGIIDIDEVDESEVSVDEPPTSDLDKLTPIESIPSRGEFSTRIIKHPGVPHDAYRWKQDYSSIKTSMDLPKIFPKSADDWNATLNSKIKVCVFNRTPRQRSIWSTDVLAMFGSGKYHYVSLEATDCQFFGMCKTGKESRAHPECDPRVSPTVGLAEWVKCCFHDRFTAAMKNQEWDVAVATGDEYCSAHQSADEKAHFRFYYDGNVSSSVQKPASYLPLGPREEFRRVLPKHVTISTERHYLFNFVGSLTSRSRRILAGVLRRGVDPSGSTSFLHTIGAWSKTITRSSGYLLPYEYRRVLLNSSFTLCPDGHNPEAYRIYEALEAGSIPIVALDQYYLSHECQHAFAPLLQSGAPIVYLNSWTGLKPFLASVYNKPELLVKMQADAMAWYARWMKNKAMEFESVMEENFKRRTQPGA